MTFCGFPHDVQANARKVSEITSYTQENSIVKTRKAATHMNPLSPRDKTEERRHTNT